LVEPVFDVTSTWQRQDRAIPQCAPAELHPAREPGDNPVVGNALCREVEVLLDVADEAPP
jgi:hypothetical protein